MALQFNDIYVTCNFSVYTYSTYCTSTSTSSTHLCTYVGVSCTYVGVSLHLYRWKLNAYSVSQPVPTPLNPPLHMCRCNQRINLTFTAPLPIFLGVKGCLSKHPKGVGTRGAQGHVPPQYFEQLAPVPPQYFQQTSGPTKFVPLQYLMPSYAPVPFCEVILH